MSKRYLLNTNSKRIHDLNNQKANCRISQMREEYKMYFDTLDEALEHPSKENPLGRKCSWCFTEGGKKNG